MSIGTDVIYVGVNATWFLLGLIVTLFVVHIAVSIAIAVLEKMTEKKKEELDRLLKEKERLVILNEHCEDDSMLH